MTEEFEVSIRLRNNRIKQCRLQLGLSTKEAAEKAGISYGIYLQYENLHSSPIGRQSEWRPSALRLAVAFGQPPDYLWPDAVLTVRKPEVLAQLRAEKVLALAKFSTEVALLEAPSPDGPCEQSEMAEEIKSVLSAALPEREAQVLSMRFGLDGGEGMTLEEVGEALSVGKERIRHIEAKALRTLRHPRYERQFKSLTGDDEGWFRVVSSETFDPEICRAPGCPNPVSKSGLLCGMHWVLIPFDLKDQYTSAVRERDGDAMLEMSSQIWSFIRRAVSSVEVP